MSWPGAVAQRAVLAVAGDRAVDERRVDLAQRARSRRRGGRARRAGRTRAATSASRDQRAAAPRGPPSVLRFEADRALAAVEREEQRRLRRVLGALVVRRRPAHVVAQAGVLDLEDVGAEVGQQQRAEAAGQQAPEVEDADAVERQARSRRDRSRGDAEHRARLGDRRRRAGRRPRSSARALAMRSPLERAIVAVGQVEVVLQADAHRAAERQRGGDEHPLRAARSR